MSFFGAGQSLANKLVSQNQFRIRDEAYGKAQVLHAKAACFRGYSNLAVLEAFKYTLETLAAINWFFGFDLGFVA